MKIRKFLRRLGRTIALAAMILTAATGIVLLVTLLHHAEAGSKPVVIHPGSSNGRTQGLDP
jgi:hypothetical protein